MKHYGMFFKNVYVVGRSKQLLEMEEKMHHHHPQKDEKDIEWLV
jgi:hypothetical protein